MVAQDYWPFSPQDREIAKIVLKILPHQVNPVFYKSTNNKIDVWKMGKRYKMSNSTQARLLLSVYDKSLNFHFASYGQTTGGIFYIVEEIQLIFKDGYL